MVLALGSNLGPAEAHLSTALRCLSRLVAPLVVAPLYRTTPISPVVQPSFLNTAALGLSHLPPDGVLAVAKSLEMQAGRQRSVRLGPRALDIDLLLYGGQVLSSPELTLPHPRLRQRRFVLAPLADLAPALPVPPDGRRVADLLEDLEETGGVERLAWSWAGTEAAATR